MRLYEEALAACSFVCREALSEMYTAFILPEPASVFLGFQSEFQGPTRHVGREDCAHHSFISQGGTTEEVSLADTSVVLLCMSCFPAAVTARNCLNPVVGVISRIKKTVERLRAGEFKDQAHVRLLAHVIPLASAYEPARTDAFSVEQRKCVEKSLATVEAALWELCRVLQPSPAEISEETSYLAYNWYEAAANLLIQTGVGLAYEEAFGEEPALAGVLLPLPRVVSEDLWVVKIPTRLVPQTVLLGKRALNLKELPAETVLKMARTFYADGMSVEDAVETAVSLY